MVLHRTRVIDSNHYRLTQFHIMIAHSLLCSSLYIQTLSQCTPDTPSYCSPA
ncbi:hypothetical protein [Rubritalea tangerina]|uniref:hypothetical protein n=1 Tax=Rubritalea tangerina TaxID=430798 RepID=UPI0036079039